MSLVLYIHYRDKQFTFHESSQLPKPLFGHCQVNVDKGRIFIYGGTTSAAYNGSKILLQHSEDAFMWQEAKGSWIKLQSKSPCPLSLQPVAFSLQCVKRTVNDAIEVIITSLLNDKICTSTFNVNTLQWGKADDVRLPLGGFLLLGIDKSSVFYVGGWQKDSILELSVNNEWRKMDTKLPFPMAMNDTYFTPSELNVTDCALDSNIRNITF